MNFANKKSPPIAHDDDGVIVIGTPRRRSRFRTPEEVSEAKAVVEARESRRDRMVSALESLSPSLAQADGPVLYERGGVIDISSARPVVTLLAIPRLSGTGQPGSELTMLAREYDGLSGGASLDYACLFVTYRNGAGFQCRTRGVAIRRGPEVDQVIAALRAWADGPKTTTDSTDTDTKKEGLE